MKWLEVPNFGIKGFNTVKYIDSLEFRPAATTLNLKNSIKDMNKERQEQNIMIKSKKIVKYINSDDHCRRLNIEPVEKMTDTKWYELEEKQKYTNFFQINNYAGEFKITEKIALPVDISLYSDNVDLNNQNKLHWYTSGGFASDFDRRVAISKGMSELIENHLKMLWWFNETPIYLINVLSNEAFFILKKQSIVKDVRVFLLGIPNKIGSYVAMCILETTKFPFVSVGFGANFVINDAVTHAVCEAVHYFRGSNWYKMLGEKETLYTNKNEEILSLVEHTKSDVSFNNLNNIENYNILTKNYNFFGKILSSKRMITVKVFSPDLQPIVNSEYVPFFIANLVNNHNVQKRQLYKGVPFI